VGRPAVATPFADMPAEPESTTRIVRHLLVHVKRGRLKKLGLPIFQARAWRTQ
jgi:hypothetical protein